MARSINFVTFKIRNHRRDYSNIGLYKIAMFAFCLIIFIISLNYTMNCVQKKWPYINFRSYYRFLISENYPTFYSPQYSTRLFQLATIGYDFSDKLTIIFFQMPVLKYPTTLKDLRSQNKLSKSNVSDHNKDSETSIPQNLSNSICEITINPKNTDGYLFGDNVLIKNHTKYLPNVSQLLNEPINLNMGNYKEPKILILHTHTTEAFSDSNSKRDRSMDPSKNVVRVGEEMSKTLRGLGINTIHDKTIHDYPDFNKSYQTALSTIERYLREYPSIKIVLDVHRDSMINNKGISYKPTTIINNQKTAQVMIVAGTNSTGLNHPNWQHNLKFAIKWQSLMKKKFTTLSRPIDLRSERFNTHVTPYSLLLEIGSSSNSLEEAINGGVLAVTTLTELLK